MLTQLTKKKCAICGNICSLSAFQKCFHECSIFDIIKGLNRFKQKKISRLLKDNNCICIWCMEHSPKKLIKYLLYRYGGSISRYRVVG